MAQALPKRQVNISVDSRVYDNLARRAKEKGLPVSTYATQLFEAAYAAGVGREQNIPVSDAELDEQVRAVFCLAGEFDTATISKALGVPESLVVKVLDGWRQQRNPKPGRKAAS
jgi:hypothetical protein